MAAFRTVQYNVPTNEDSSGYTRMIMVPLGGMNDRITKLNKFRRMVFAPGSDKQGNDW